MGLVDDGESQESMALLLREALRVGKISYSPYFSASMTKLEAKKRVGEDEISVVSPNLVARTLLR